MQAIFCDSCKKQIKEPIRDVNYKTILSKALCLKCENEYQQRVSDAMMSKKRYIFLDQKKLLYDTLFKMCR